jgi:hypothetical protein
MSRLLANTNRTKFIQQVCSVQPITAMSAYLTDNAVAMGQIDMGLKV